MQLCVVQRVNASASSKYSFKIALLRPESSGSSPFAWLDLAPHPSFGLDRRVSKPDPSPLSFSDSTPMGLWPYSSNPPDWLIPSTAHSSSLWSTRNVALRLPPRSEETSRTEEALFLSVCPRVAVASPLPAQIISFSCPELVTAVNSGNWESEDVTTLSADSKADNSPLEHSSSSDKMWVLDRLISGSVMVSTSEWGLCVVSSFVFVPCVASIWSEECWASSIRWTTVSAYALRSCSLSMLRGEEKTGSCSRVSTFRSPVSAGLLAFNSADMVLPSVVWSPIGKGKVSEMLPPHDQVILVQILNIQTNLSLKTFSNVV